ACGFCETGKMGLLRHLTVPEIVGQVVVARSLGKPIRNLVFMGMGEPLDNVDNLVGALAVLNDKYGLSYGQERITVCTAGIPAGLERLARLGWKRLDLSISLNAATDPLRDRLMPINKRHPLAELQAALVAYPRRKSFVYAINYCLMPGINDTQGDAQAVADFCRPLGRALVNL
ncbi:MAG: radical SAM protein, partial [Phycisphaerae bacterium]|nr:radical SAM protein [Phycisphaerae bacterium]